MAVYIINNMTMRDRDAYQTYLRGFMPVFRKYGGTVLATQDDPVAVEGDWPYQRTVLLSVPSRELARLWMASPEYQQLAEHRRAGTTSNVLFLDGLPAAVAYASAA
jgi:uncharacterized protein (DUF1330 family)